MTRSRSRSTPSSASVSRAALAVHDDPVEAREEPAPEIGAVRGAAGEKVVRREDRGQVRAEEVRVELGRGQPLDVQHVRAEAAERGEPERMLRDLERQAQPRAAEDARRERDRRARGARYPSGSGAVAEAEARGDELDVRARARERRGELVVVRRREGRWIGEQDAHGLVRYAVAMLVRTWNLFHGNAVAARSGAPSSSR